MGAQAWAGEPQELRPTGSVEVIITDVCANRPELLKVVRAITGLGLADVAAMLDELPVRVVTGTTREKAEELRAQLLAAGAEPSFVDEAAHQLARGGAAACGTDRARGALRV